MLSLILESWRNHRKFLVSPCPIAHSIALILIGDEFCKAQLGFRRARLSDYKQHLEQEMPRNSYWTKVKCILEESSQPANETSAQHQQPMGTEDQQPMGNELKHPKRI